MHKCTPWNAANGSTCAFCLMDGCPCLRLHVAALITDSGGGMKQLLRALRRMRDAGEPSLPLVLPDMVHGLKSIFQLLVNNFMAMDGQRFGMATVKVMLNAKGVYSDRLRAEGVTVEQTNPRDAQAWKTSDFITKPGAVAALKDARTAWPSRSWAPRRTRATTSSARG